MTFGAFTFGSSYFSEIPLLSVEPSSSRVGGTPSDIDYHRADRDLRRRQRQQQDEVDLFALGQALGVIDP